VQQQKVLASDGGSKDYFGGAIAISGDTIVVGAEQHDGSVFGFRGSLCLCEKPAGWVEQQKLTADIEQVYSGFGLSVALSGQTIVVGALRDDTNGNSDAGAAYVFIWTGTRWMQQQSSQQVLTPWWTKYLA